MLFSAPMLLAVPRYDFATLMFPYCLTGSLIGAGERRATRELVQSVNRLAATRVVAGCSASRGPFLPMATIAKAAGLQFV